MKRRRPAGSGASFLDRALAEIEQFTPSTGANLVGLDTFEPPGEKLYLIGWFRTRAAADAALVKRARLQTDEHVYVYAAEAPSTRARRKGRRTAPRKRRETRAAGRASKRAGTGRFRRVVRRGRVFVHVSRRGPDRTEALRSCPCGNGGSNVKLLTAPIDALRLSDVDAFLALDRSFDERPREGLRFDFKQDVPKDLAKIVASFANSSGGFAVIGVQCDGPTPIARPGVARARAELGTRIANVIDSGIAPPGPSYDVRVFELADAASAPEVALVRVPQSEEAPHMLTSGIVPVRVADRSVPASLAEIERLLAARSYQVATQHRSGAGNVWLQEAPGADGRRAESQTFLRLVAHPRRRHHGRVDRTREGQYEEIVRRVSGLPYRPHTRGAGHVEWRHDEPALGLDRRWIVSDDMTVAYLGQIVRHGEILIVNVVDDLATGLACIANLFDVAKVVGRVGVSVELRFADVPVRSYEEFGRDLLGVHDIRNDLADTSQPFVEIVDTSQLAAPAGLIADALFVHLRSQRGASVDLDLLRAAIVKIVSRKPV